VAELLDEIHPGEILLDDFMKPMGISALQISPTCVACRAGPAE
jgi:plasmid maintenance system antidote protein VapI